AGLGASLPRAAASAAWPWAIVVLPLRGAGTQASGLEATAGRRACRAPNRKGKKRLGGVALYPGRRPRRPCPGLLSCCPFGAPEGRTRSVERTAIRRASGAPTRKEKRGWVGWLFTQGGGLGGLALGYCRAAPSGRRKGEPASGDGKDG